MNPLRTSAAYSETGSERGALRRLGFFLVAVIAVSVMIAGAKFSLESGIAWICPSILLFQLPCPSCGSTRALAALADLNPLRAFSYNPLFVLGLGTLVCFPFLRQFSWDRFQNAGWIIFSAAVGLNWLYLLIYLPR